MPIYSLGDKTPAIAQNSFVAEGAIVIGDVTLSELSSVWFGAVLRADNDSISIGPSSNIQEGAILHTDPGHPIHIANHVTVGHQAMLHGCRVGEGSLIGIQAVLLNGSVIGKNCLVGAGALVTEGKTFPDNSLIIGTPAKAVRSLSDEEVQRLKKTVTGYVSRSETYKTNLKRI
ncbi:MAG TPA: gamma carbonic anhydrase family protein [Eoetvoesiella sp.]